MQGGIPKAYLCGKTSNGITVSKQWELEKKIVDCWDILGLRMVYYWDLDFWL